VVVAVVETRAWVAMRVAPEVGMEKILADDRRREREYYVKHGGKATETNWTEEKNTGDRRRS
jgi:hypothetical protein